MACILNPTCATVAQVPTIRFEALEQKGDRRLFMILLKNPPFILRQASGGAENGIAMIKKVPFMLSLSKHFSGFFQQLAKAAE